MCGQKYTQVGHSERALPQHITSLHQILTHTKLSWKCMGLIEVLWVVEGLTEVHHSSTLWFYGVMQSDCGDASLCRCH